MKTLLAILLCLPLIAVAQPDKHQGKGKGNKPQTHQNMRKQQVTHGAQMPHGQGQHRQLDRTRAANADVWHGRKEAKWHRSQVNEFRNVHRHMFNLGWHPRNYFINRFGWNYVRLIGNSYFVYVDGCWVAVAVDGYNYVERVICPGDLEYLDLYLE